MPARETARSGQTPSATELEVDRALEAIWERLTGRRVSGGKAAVLRSAATLGVTPEDLGTRVAHVSDHPWALGMAACRDIDEVVDAWQVPSAAGSSHNVTQVRHDDGRSVLVVHRRRADGGKTDEAEDRFVLGLLRGFLILGPGLEVLDATAQVGPDGRTWRLPLGQSRAIARPLARWGDVGPVSGAVVSVLDGATDADVGHVANALSLSSRTLQRRLAEEGTTFRQVRHRARVAAAAGAVSTGATLTDAAHDAGFADSAHLSREFRRLVGVQPAQWRRWSPSAVGGRAEDGATVQGRT